jgi:hypothetical protein
MAYVGVQALDGSGAVLATAEPGSWPLGVPDRLAAATGG